MASASQYSVDGSCGSDLAIYYIRSHLLSIRVISTVFLFSLLLLLRFYYTAQGSFVLALTILIPRTKTPIVVWLSGPPGKPCVDWRATISAFWEVLRKNKWPAGLTLFQFSVGSWQKLSWSSLWMACLRGGVQGSPILKFSYIRGVSYTDARITTSRGRLISGSSCDNTKKAEKLPILSESTALEE